MKRFVIPLVSCALVSGAVLAYDGPPWFRVKASEKQISFAKDKASYSLLDPSSAQFRNMFAISRGRGDDSVCGEMNAKNSYGAYTGFKLFYVEPDGTYQVESPDDAMGMMPGFVCNKPAKPIK